MSQLLFWPWSKWLTRTLIDEPVPLGSPTTVACTVHVPLREPYELSFSFVRRWEGEDIRDYLYGRGYFKRHWPVGDTVIPVSWSLTDVRSGRVIASGVEKNLQVSGWSQDSVYMHIASPKVPVGTYLFKAEVLGAIAPELRGVTPRLLLALPGHKASSTWQLTVVFWGALVSTLIIWPLILILGGFALWLARPQFIQSEAASR
ncbi:hypothetical protein ACFOLC_13590 [Lysobacter cavernae]|uniref:DUF4178 domain-containing protein n=1 Tax=Lysobacter cavernae TaxID=1685901 RepID=A0ABV7RTF1_9GAMM